MEDNSLGFAGIFIVLTWLVLGMMSLTSKMKKMPDEIADKMIEKLREEEKRKQNSERRT